MSLLKVLSASLALVTLSGCAGHRPMPDSEYSRLAVNWYADYQCGVLGHMDATTVAGGRAQVSNALRFFDDYNQDRFNQEIVRLHRSGAQPTKEQCFSRAIQIAQFTGNGRGNASSTSSSANNYGVDIQRPVTTYCNKIGTQTFCNSF